MSFKGYYRGTIYNELYTFKNVYKKKAPIFRRVITVQTTYI